MEWLAIIMSLHCMLKYPLNVARNDEKIRISLSTGSKNEMVSY